MKTTGEDTIARLAAAGLERCLARFDGASNGKWKLEALTVSGGPSPAAVGSGPGSLRLPEAVRVTVGGETPFTTLFLYGAGDAEHINLCFVDDGLYSSFGPDRREVTLLELGNILLNALANSLLKAFEQTAIPSVPERVGHGSIPDKDERNAAFLTVTAEISMSRGGRTAAAVLLALIPRR